ncbi:MAG: hypothetical protein LBR91_01470 [Puniceicoccales bacterium]|jgi:hypothetical protein|nr:hypothetical protein [Puniceicoccales bacterium]
MHKNSINIPSLTNKLSSDLEIAKKISRTTRTIRSIRKVLRVTESMLLGSGTRISGPKVGLHNIRRIKVSKKKKDSAKLSVPRSRILHENSSSQRPHKPAAKDARGNILLASNSCEKVLSAVKSDSEDNNIFSEKLKGSFDFSTPEVREHDIPCKSDPENNNVFIKESKNLSGSVQNFDQLSAMIKEEDGDIFCEKYKDSKRNFNLTHGPIAPESKIVTEIADAVQKCKDLFMRVMKEDFSAEKASTLGEEALVSIANDLNAKIVTIVCNVFMNLVADVGGIICKNKEKFYEDVKTLGLVYSCYVTMKQKEEMGGWLAYAPKKLPRNISKYFSVAQRNAEQGLKALWGA